MRLPILAFYLLCLTACEEYTHEIVPDALATHVCSVEEMKRVESETLFCSQKTTYRNNYCYETAIKRNCKLRGN